MTAQGPDRSNWPQADPIHLEDAVVPGVWGLFGGIALGTLVTILGFITGVLPFGSSDLRDPCRLANVSELVPEAWKFHGTGGRTGARCTNVMPISPPPTFVSMQIDLAKPGPRDRAIADHQRGCTSLQ
ncbi:hypothetical protein ACFQ07_25700, partial [Actinomadura adrarensis]